MKTTFQFSDSFSRGDLTKRGPGDFYDDKRPEILAALRSGLDFDTGWGGCKKEILSSRLSREGDTLTAEVSVSDDFDTEGIGSHGFTLPAGLSDDGVFALLDEVFGAAGDAAAAEQKENQVYRGFKILDASGRWVETYIQQTGDFGDMLEEPPGDYYSQWGFQEDRELPEAVRTVFQEWIEGYPEDNENLTVGGFTVQPWQD